MRVDAECGLHGRRQRDRLRGARVDAAARRNRGRIVVGPARAFEREHARALGEARRGIGVRIEEHVPVIERGDQPDMRRQQHPVAEHVAGHVADADHREIGRLRIDAHLAEVPLHRLPRAARGDRHLLVVVADRAARCERVVEPEAVFMRDRVRVVGEGGRALVGGDDQVRVIRIVTHDVGRRHDCVAHEVVGQVEQAAQEGLVARDAFAHPRFAIARRRRVLHDEAAFRADRHDHDVLHHLRLHQPEHFGAEILAAIRPAQAAARDASAAQVHALDTRRIHPDLEHRLRFGQARHLRRIELERQVRFRFAVRVGEEVVRALGCVDHAEELAQDAVLVEVRHLVERAFDRLQPPPARRARRRWPGRNAAGTVRRAAARSPGCRSARARYTRR